MPAFAGEAYGAQANAARVPLANPAAALLAEMGYNEQKRRQVRMACLRMPPKFRRTMDDVRIALFMYMADRFHQPGNKERILRELRERYPKPDTRNPDEDEALMEMVRASTKRSGEEGR